MALGRLRAMKRLARRVPCRIGKDIRMLWTIAVILVVLWLLGFAVHVAGAFIHLLLVIAVIVIVFQLVSGRRGSSL